MVAMFVRKYHEWHDMIIVGSEWLLVGYAKLLTTIQEIELYVLLSLVINSMRQVLI